MQFRIRALDDSHAQMITLAIDALDEADARSQASARQLVALSVERVAGWPLRRRDSDFSATLFAQELHALVQAGLSLVESLEALVEKDADASTRALLERLLAALREGQRFSAALRAQGASFTPLFVGIVEAAESTGELAAALERYLAYATRMQAVRQRMLSAAIYPAILLSVGGLVGLFLMAWVVPRFATVYQGAGRTLPWASQLLLDWGQFAGQHGGWLLAGLACGAIALGLWLRNTLKRADAAGLLVGLVAWLPGVARWIELLNLSRLFLTLGLLLRGGLPIQPALALAASVLPAARQSSVARASQRIAEGQSLSAALQEFELSTPISLRLVRAGERSGQLAEMLHRAALYHDAETSRWVERFSRTFEPLLMAAIGIVIGVIVLLLYMPIFDLAGSLQ